MSDNIQLKDVLYNTLLQLKSLRKRQVSCFKNDINHHNILPTRCSYQQHNKMLQLLRHWNENNQHSFDMSLSKLEVAEKDLAKCSKYIDEYETKRPIDKPEYNRLVLESCSRAIPYNHSVQNRVLCNLSENMNEINVTTQQTDSILKASIFISKLKAEDVMRIMTQKRVNSVKKSDKIFCQESKKIKSDYTFTDESCIDYTNPNISRKKNRTNRSLSNSMDSVVIPLDVVASTRVEKIEYKDIPTPGWIVLDKNSSDASKQISNEDISDDAYIKRHVQCELDERKRFTTAKQPVYKKLFKNHKNQRGSYDSIDNLSNSLVSDYSIGTNTNNNNHHFNDSTKNFNKTEKLFIGKNRVVTSSCVNSDTSLKTFQNHAPVYDSFRKEVCRHDHSDHHMSSNASTCITYLQAPQIKQ